MRMIILAAVLAPTLALAAPHGGGSAPTSSTGGSAGTASVGGTSASTIGLGAQSGHSSAMGMGASAAGGTHDMSRAAVHGNNNLNGQAMAQAHDGGTFSKSHTHCHDTECTTKTMAHEPGSKPVKSTSTSGE